MKKEVFGFAAIAIAIAASAFTVPASSKTSGKLTSYKWFLISNTHAAGAIVPKADASYLSEGTTAPTESGCGTTQPNQCVSGFDDSQVNPSTEQLINDMQAPPDSHYKRN